VEAGRHCGKGVGGLRAGREEQQGQSGIIGRLPPPVRKKDNLVKRL